MTPLEAAYALFSPGSGRFLDAVDFAGRYQVSRTEARPEARRIALESGSAEVRERTWKDKTWWKDVEDANQTVVKDGYGENSSVNNEANAQIYFSDVFGVDKEALEEHGAFNISLIADLPLFIDPFLLFNSKDEQYQQLHESIIEYMRFLKEVSVKRPVPQELLHQWFAFPEVSQNWFGFSKFGNPGQGTWNGLRRSPTSELRHCIQGLRRGNSNSK